MSAIAYFDLVNSRSLRVIGLSGRHYLFVKGRPTPVKDERDAGQFRSRPRDLVECDDKGKPLVEVFTGTKPLSSRTLSAIDEAKRALAARQADRAVIASTTPQPPAKEAVVELTQEQAVERTLAAGGPPYKCILCGKELGTEAGIKRHVGSKACVAE